MEGLAACPLSSVSLPSLASRRNGPALSKTPMEDSSQTQRLILAAILCFGVIIAWEHFFPSMPPASTQAPASSADAGLEPEQNAGTPRVTRSSTLAAGADPSGEAEIAIETFEFRGEVKGSDGKPIPYELSLTNLGGGIERFALPSFFERTNVNASTENVIHLAETDLGPALERQMAGIELVGDSTVRLPKRPIYTVVDKTDKTILYRYETPEGLVIDREYSLSADSFAIEMAVTLRNDSGKPQSLQLQISSVLERTASAESAFFFAPAPDHLSGLCFTEGKVEREAQQSLAEEGKHFEQAVKWVAMDRQYFVAAIVQRDGSDAECRLRGSGRSASASLLMPLTKLDAGEEKRHKFTSYLGVKKPEFLTRVDAGLEAAVDYTILGLNLAIICEGLLAIMALIFGFSGSWGLSILGLTVLVKLVLFPLNQRSGKSMRAMSALKPEMDAIRVKFPDDRQRQSEEMMRLYQKYNVNPASGCVPILIQMPIWFALYRALWVSVDLYQADFMWIPDLTARDPLYILPALLIVVMFVQQKTTPTAMDPTQQKIMLYMMPLLFGSMMVFLPAGLVFYILVNSVLTILQQHFINKSIGPAKGPSSAQPATA